MERYNDNRKFYTMVYGAKRSLVSKTGIKKELQGSTMRYKTVKKSLGIINHYNNLQYTLPG